jgi:CBS domain containing-hemolysin-like protein
LHSKHWFLIAAQHTSLIIYFIKKVTMGTGEAIGQQLATSALSVLGAWLAQFLRGFVLLFYGQLLAYIYDLAFRRFRFRIVHGPDPLSIERVSQRGIPQRFHPMRDRAPVLAIL